MKAEYAIPAGWARLAVGTEIKEGDLFLRDGEWQPSRASGESCGPKIWYIRKSEAPRSTMSISLVISPDGKKWTVQRTYLKVKGGIEIESHDHDNPIDAAGELIRCATATADCMVATVTKTILPGEVVEVVDQLFKNIGKR